jgi:uncharacterized protein YbbC (DUF1343 family)
MVHERVLTVVIAAGLLPAASCVSNRRAAEPPSRLDVRPGIEVLLTDSGHLVRGRRVGLVTNQAGIDRAGARGVDRLLAAGISVVALFSPEHGFRGTAEPGAPVASTIDSATRLPIYSLYGGNTAPTDTMLAGVDVLLVDLQDAGARYYTYLWTTVEVMRAAQRHGVPVVVLDRPNPIGGQVQGNVLDTTYRSTVGLVAVPMRHGMTLGELVRLARHDLGLTTALTVIPVRGWRRSMYFDETGLPFVPPSPNLRSLEALIHYPGLCLFEGTTLSVGRGTDRPFEQVGAPGLDTARVLAAVRAAPLPGVAFEGVSFTPRRPGDAKFDGVSVTGIRLRVVDRTVYDPTQAAVALLGAMADVSGIVLFPPDTRHFDRLVGDGGLTREAFRVYGSPALGLRAAVLRGWNDEVRGFLKRRRPFLIYRD